MPSDENTTNELSECYPVLFLNRDPPTELLLDLRESISDLEPIGPSYDRVDLLARVQRGAFEGHRLNTVVENHIVKWVSERNDLLGRILENLPCQNWSSKEVWAHLQCYHKLVAKRAILSYPGVQLSDEELIKRGLVWAYEARVTDLFKPGTAKHYYASVNPDWSRFFIAYRELKSELDTLVEKCLKEGRVLAVQIGAFGPELIPPYSWNDKRTLPTKDVEMRYVLTDELPDSWYYANLGPRGKKERQNKAKAIKWLEKEYRKSRAKNQKATKSRAFPELAKRFEIQSKTLQLEVWTEARIDLWKKSGPPKIGSEYMFDNNK